MQPNDRHFINSFLILLGTLVIVLLSSTWFFLLGTKSEIKHCEERVEVLKQNMREICNERIRRPKGEQ